MAVGLMLSLGLVSKKLPFWLGLTGPAEPRGGRSKPRKKNPFSKQIGFGPQVGFGYAKTWPELDPLPFLVLKVGKY